MRYIPYLLCSAAAFLLLAGCQKSGPVGRQIRFTGISGQAARTKTAYSGEKTGNVERIDWVAGDQVRIYSAEAATGSSDHYADYTIRDVETPSADLTVSRAAIVASSSSDGLNWGTGTHTFYALYPSPATDDVQYGVDFTDGTFTGVIPASQTVTGSTGSYTWNPDMNLAYMLARTTGVASGADAVSLLFKPVFTAVAFTVDSGENASVSVSGFTLQAADGDTDNYPAGTVCIADTDYETPANYSFSDTERTISVTFSPALTVTSGHPVTFTVMALPRAMSGLSVTFTGTEIGTRSLSLSESNGDPIAFVPGKKYHIQNLSFPLLLPVTPGDEIIWDNTYTVDDVEDPVVWGTGVRTESVDWRTGSGTCTGDDQVSVYLGSAYRTLDIQDDQTVLLGAETRSNYAVYPPSVAVDGHVTEADFHILYPAAYDCSAMTVAEIATWSPLPMVAANDPSAGDLLFYNTGALLRLTAPGVPANAAAIRVVLPGKNVTGEFQVNDPGTATASLEEVSGETYGDEITFTLPALSSAQDIVLNVPLPAGEYPYAVVEALDDGNNCLASGYVSLGANDTFSRAWGRAFTSSLSDTDSFMLLPEGAEKYKFRGLYLSPGVLVYDGNTEAGSHGYKLTDGSDPLELLQHWYLDTQSGGAGLNVWYHAWSGTNSLKHRLDGESAAEPTSSLQNTIKAAGTIWRVPSGGDGGEWYTIMEAAPSRKLRVNASPYSDASRNYVYLTVDLENATPANGAAMDYSNMGLMSAVVSNGVITGYNYDYTEGPDRFRYQSGVLVIPDGVVLYCPRIQTVHGNFTNVSGKSNLITWQDLKLLTDAGCVFMPTAGFYRGNGEWWNAGFNGYYWSSTRVAANPSYVIASVFDDSWNFTHFACEGYSIMSDTSHCNVKLVHD
jgi:hypothetical protein